MKIANKKLVKEHKGLVDTLKHPTKKKLKKELKEQSSELKRYKKLAKKPR